MPDRVHILELPTPEVAWVLGGVAEVALTEVHTARTGHAEPGEVLGGTPGTSSAAVTSLPGEIGRQAVRIDAGGRARLAVPVAADDEPGDDPRGEPASVHVGREDLPAWVARLEAAACRADRHGSPDLSAQLIAASRRPIDKVVCHVLEPDPILALQSQWALRHPDEFLVGLRLLTRLTGAGDTVVVADVRDARRLERRLARVLEERATSGLRLPRMMPVDNTYPQSDPSLLAHTVARRRLPPGALPTEAGLLILDAVAAVAVGEVVLGSTCIRREPIAVRDHRGDLGLICNAWRGSRLCDVLLYTGMIHRDPDLAPTAAMPAVRAGDYLREAIIPPNAVLGGRELVFHVEAPQLAVDPDPCIRCGWCLDICPTGVHPAGALEAAASDKPAERAKMAVQFGAAACIGCGLCSYVCPSRLPLREATLRVRDEMAVKAR